MLHTGDCVLYRGTSIHVTYRWVCTLQRHICTCCIQVGVHFTEAHLYMLHTGEWALYRGTTVHVTYRWVCNLQRHICTCYTQVTVHFTDAHLYMLHTGALHRDIFVHVTHTTGAPKILQWTSVHLFSVYFFVCLEFHWTTHSVAQTVSCQMVLYQ